MPIKYYGSVNISISPSLAYFNTFKQSVTHTGGRKYLRWWKNKWIGYVQIKEANWDSIPYYLEELQEHAKYHWELHANGFKHKIVVRFYNEKDLLYFKLAWG